MAREVEEEDRLDDEAAEEEDDGESRKKKRGKLKSDEKQMAMFAHIGCIFLGFVAPLIIWMMKKDESRFIEKHAKEALNFSITAAIIIMGGSLLCGLGLLYVPVAAIFNIIAGMAANKGESYNYPMTIRFIK